MLIHLWHKVLADFMTRLGKRKQKDILTTALINNIIEVPEHIRYACLKYYLIQCHRFNRIAFFQWRLMFPNSKYTNKDELEDMLDSYFDDLYWNYEKIDDHKNHKPNEKTVKGA